MATFTINVGAGGTHRAAAMPFGEEIFPPHREYVITLSGSAGEDQSVTLRDGETRYRFYVIPGWWDITVYAYEVAQDGEAIYRHKLYRGFSREHIRAGENTVRIKMKQIEENGSGGDDSGGGDSEENVIWVTNPAFHGTGSIHEAFNQLQDGATIRFDLPSGSGNLIELNHTLNVNHSNVTIEGNGVRLSPNPGWTQGAAPLIHVGVNSTTTIRRIHFHGASASGNQGTAIHNQNGKLIIESCIFSDNKATAVGGYASVIFNSNNGTLVVRGSTFYNNSFPAGANGGVIALSSGRVDLSGNLFFANTIGPTPNGVKAFGMTSAIVSLGYNVINLPTGEGAGGSGWTHTPSDTFRTSTPFAPNTFFEPVDALRIIPSHFGNDHLPAKDFLGNPRTWPGAPGAVN